MSERKAGYYWVKDGLGWEPLRWSGYVWDGHFNDADFEEIGHRIPTPDEPWQCVPKEPTPAMVESGCEAYGDCDRSGICYGDCHCSPTPTAWSAMLSAAPAPSDTPSHTAETTDNQESAK